MANRHIFVGLLIFLCISSVAAFGAGHIPTYAYLKQKAFRHGDIEDTLADLIMRRASGIFSKNTKFSGLMVKQVYFGNWLRDYSQVIDIGTLSRGIKLGTLRILVWALGFATFGYATGEFEVTDERLGSYRPEEHIDNPKGYGEGQDAKALDKRLRGPVDAEEYAVDTRTGMNNYIANEDGGWDTSAGYVRTSLKQCIEYGRRYQTSKSETDLFEAFRLLGQSLHTLEDFSAHSNYCELALIELGYNNVFAHVGSNTKIQLQGKTVYPLVTGIFGGADFMYSLLGEANDHLLQSSIEPISQTGVGDLSNKFSDSQSGGNFDFLKNLLSKIPGGKTDDLNQQMDEITKTSDDARESGSVTELDPEELAQKVYPILEFRDKVAKMIENTIDQIPGFNELVEELTNALATFVLTQLEPLISPIIGQVTGALHEGSSMVISDETQYQVWNDPNSSTPTHSMLSKDHFTAYLNEPAGKIAIVIVKHTVELVTEAWSKSDIDPRNICDDILSAFHHPALRGRDKVQNEMFEIVRSWIEKHDVSARDTILEGLTAEGVKGGRNQKRPEGEDDSTPTHGCGGPKAPLNYGKSQSNYELGSGGLSNDYVTSSHDTTSEQFTYQRPDEFGQKRAQGYARDSYEELAKYGERPLRTNVAPSSGEAFSSKQDSQEDGPYVDQYYESPGNQRSNEFEIETPSANSSYYEQKIYECSSQPMPSYNDMGNQLDMIDLRGKTKYERQYEDEM